MANSHINIPIEALLTLTESDPERPRLYRAQAVALPLDQKIDEREIGEVNWLQSLMISGLHLYRKLRPARIGNRCAFEPSCSRYAEISIEYDGVKSGLQNTLSRLKRCRSENGGIDISSEHLTRLEKGTK